MSDSVFGEKNKIINFFKEQLLLRRLEAEIREVSSADLQSGRNVSLLCPDPLQFLSPCRESDTILILLQPGDITAPSLRHFCSVPIPQSTFTTEKVINK